ncbi:MAG: tetratricopeptide repeat protein [Treponema sp.]|jgi:tetratricopeptide (TPR) repeat protein|nr:tetratricopeptide repeat protein [Treponema sp.]
MAERRQKRIHFLSVPESLRGKIEDVSQDCGFSINPDIPIPVEIPENDEKLNLEELSWEMIAAGMLHVIAAGPGAFIPAEKGEWIDYYRHFVLALRPNILGEFTEAAVLKARNGDFDPALEIFDALQGLFPASPVVKLNRALAMEERAALFQRRGKPEAEAAFREAEAAYEDVLSVQPPFPEAYFNAGFFYLGRKDFRSARECLSLYIEYSDDGEKQEQAAAIIKNINENGLEDENFNAAYQLICQEKEEEGMARIRGFIEKHPSVWNGWFILGWALRRLGRWKDGAAAFCKAVELDGSVSDSRNELAICLMECGDLKGARRELEAALRLDPDNIKIISNLGVLAVKSGNSAEAAAFFRAVHELDPEDAIANGYLEIGG